VGVAGHYRVHSGAAGGVTSRSANSRRPRRKHDSEWEQLVESVAIMGDTVSFGKDTSVSSMCAEVKNGTISLNAPTVFPAILSDSSLAKGRSPEELGSSAVGAIGNWLDSVKE
jgi:hypothetical protein